MFTERERERVMHHGKICVTTGTLAESDIFYTCLTSDCSLVGFTSVSIASVVSGASFNG